MPITVAFDAKLKGSWFLHCHHLYHMATGMMTEINVLLTASGSLSRIAAAAMAFSSVTVVTNANRLRYLKPRRVAS